MLRLEVFTASSQLLPATPCYSLLLPTTPNYSQLLPTTPNYSQPLPSTPRFKARHTEHEYGDEPPADPNERTELFVGDLSASQLKRYHEAQSRLDEQVCGHGWGVN